MERKYLNINFIRHRIMVELQHTSKTIQVLLYHGFHFTDIDYRQLILAQILFHHRGMFIYNEQLDDVLLK